jgi:nicotinic acid mononucleotide adenylyltransferase
MTKHLSLLCSLYTIVALSNSDISSHNHINNDKHLLYSDVKIGLYSGTFDPPTKAHNAIIRSAIKNLGLERLYIFVNKNGEKNYKCSSQQRVKMLQLMLSDLQDKVVVVAQASDNKRSDYLMIKKILSQKIIHITGDDSYQRRLLVIPENRVTFDAIALVSRNNEQQKNEALPQLEENVFYLPITSSEDISSVSSTKTRAKLAMKNYNNIALTPEVLSYIIEHSLYYFPGNIKDKQVCFEEKFYAHVGKIYSPCPVPEFDPLASEDSWEENFYKWLLINTKKTI